PVDETQSPLTWLHNPDTEGSRGPRRRSGASVRGAGSVASGTTVRGAGSVASGTTVRGAGSVDEVDQPTCRRSLADSRGVRSPSASTRSST
ncbi:hypothetical protein CYJ73_24650, partial [Gordonia terrae]